MVWVPEKARAVGGTVDVDELEEALGEGVDHALGELLPAQPAPEEAEISAPEVFGGLDGEKVEGGGDLGGREGAARRGEGQSLLVTPRGVRPSRAAREADELLGDEPMVA